MCMRAFAALHRRHRHSLVIWAREAKGHREREEKITNYSTYFPIGSLMNGDASEWNQIRNGNEHRAKTKKKAV